MEGSYHKSEQALPYLISPFYFNIHLDIEAPARLEKLKARRNKPNDNNNI
jgi:hypothetical protein